MSENQELSPAEIEFDLVIAAASLAAAPDATAETIVYFRRLWEAYISQYFLPDIGPLCARVKDLRKNARLFAFDLRTARERAYPRHPKPTTGGRDAPQRFKPEHTARRKSSEQEPELA